LDTPQKSAIKTRLELRKYISKSNSFPKGTYWAGDLFFKRVRTFEDFFIKRGCTDGNCTYTEKLEDWCNRNIIASHFKVGRQIHFKNENKNTSFLFDMYFGLGLRHIFYTFSNISLKAEDIDFSSTGDGFFYLGPGYQLTLPSMQMGFKIAFDPSHKKRLVP
jgi:hypothetical protein